MKRIITLDTAKAQYGLRYTLDHIPAWAKKPCGNGLYYAPQFASDSEWYANTVFPGEGHIHRNDTHAQTRNESWPCGRWLEVPIHTTKRSDCGHVRLTYRPDWDKVNPWASYRDGTAGRHFARLSEAVQFFAAQGSYFSEGK